MTLLVFGAVFASGLLIGAALDRTDRGGDRTPEETSREDGGERGPRPLIVDQVGLSEAQEFLIDSIIDVAGIQLRARQDYHEEEYRRERRELVAQIREDIISVLTPEQGRQYRELLAARDSARAESRRRQESEDGERRE